MSLHKSNRWASEAKDCIDQIINSYEEAEKESSERIAELEEELAEAKQALREAQENLADAQSELASIAAPEDPTSPFNR